MHVALFGERVGFDEAEQRALLAPSAGAACWSARERLIVRLADQLHDTSTIDDALWAELKAEFSDAQLLELVMLAGSYHMVSFLTNALRLPPESYAALPGVTAEKRARCKHRAQVWEVAERSS